MLDKCQIGLDMKLLLYISATSFGCLERMIVKFFQSQQKIRSLGQKVVVKSKSNFGIQKRNCFKWYIGRKYRCIPHYNSTIDSHFFLSENLKKGCMDPNSNYIKLISNTKQIWIYKGLKISYIRIQLEMSKKVRVRI